jgi:hypothetical protein
VRVALALALVILGSATVADAYPRFQFSTGSERCSACHVAPEGGGLLNDFGRSEASDTISRGGDGSFLHGAWQPPIALGGDFRFATLARARREDDPELVAFPMQADLHARVGAGPIALQGTVGLASNARIRPEGAGLGTYLISREHYVSYQREPGEPYVRVGRFYPVLGLRSADHTALVWRALDYYVADEPYAIGVGTASSRYEVHASLFAPNPTASGAQSLGATAYVERFLDDGSIAGQARFATSDDDQRVLVGAIAKRWLPKPKLLLLGELDVQRQAIKDADVTRLSVAGYVGVTRVMLPGLLVGAALQRWTPDLALRGSARSTAEVDVQLLPWAHFELHLLARAGLIGGRGGSPDSLVLFQLHYYL